jgi:hypothetical protein
MSSSKNNNTSTPPGYNYSIREISRLLLGITALALFTNANSIATMSSAGAVTMLRGGTMFSIKNIKWTILSIISFLFCLTISSLQNTVHVFQPNDSNGDRNSWNLIALLFLGQMKFLQMFWGGIITFVLVSAYTTKVKEYDSKINHLTPAKIM